MSTSTDDGAAPLLDEGRARAAATDPDHARLWDALARATEGGKRFRPALVTSDPRRAGRHRPCRGREVGAARRAAAHRVRHPRRRHRRRPRAPRPAQRERHLPRPGAGRRAPARGRRRRLRPHRRRSSPATSRWPPPSAPSPPAARRPTSPTGCSTSSTPRCTPRRRASSPTSASRSTSRRRRWPRAWRWRSRRRAPTPSPSRCRPAPCSPAPTSRTVDRLGEAGRAARHRLPAGRRPDRRVRRPGADRARARPATCAPASRPRCWSTRGPRRSGQQIRAYVGRDLDDAELARGPRLLTASGSRALRRGARRRSTSPRPARSSTSLGHLRSTSSTS